MPTQSIKITAHGRTHTYRPTTGDTSPAGVRYSVPRQWQGQTVEYAFGCFGVAEGDVGDKWLMVTDRSDGSVIYYRSGC